MTTDKMTRLMRAVEAEHQDDLETILVRMLTKHGITGTANLLGVSKTTVCYWMDKYNIRIVRVAIAPGEQAVVHRNPDR